LWDLRPLAALGRAQQHARMQTKLWVRRIVFAVVWGLAVSTWASIARFFFGAPDVGLILVAATMALVLLGPVVHVPRKHRGPHAADAAMHRGIRSA
jgi:hypothetical protein